MSDSEHTTNAPANKHSESLFNKMLDVLAWPASIATGVQVARNEVRNRAYKTQQKRGKFDDLSKHYENKFKIQDDLRLSNAISAEEHSAAVAKIKSEHSAAVEARMQNLGLGSFAKKWASMNRDNKQMVIIQGATIGSIILGAMIATADHALLHAHFDKDQDPQSR